MREAVEAWSAKRYGVCLDGVYIQYQAWADDLLLFSPDLAQIRDMFAILVNSLHKCGMSVQPGSLEILSSSGEWPSASLEWPLGDRTYEVLCKDTLCILGVYVDSRGSTSAAVRGRINAA
jgi:hypothetical protein